jgi:hypothetical protein
MRVPAIVSTISRKHSIQRLSPFFWQAAYLTAVIDTDHL